MLINLYEHNVDAKGRVFVPAKWRDDLGETVVVTRSMLGRGDSRCLVVFSFERWSRLLERAASIELSDVKAQNEIRKLFANACECELDKQGRILISARLLSYAGIEKDAVLIGMGNRAEIWSARVWDEHEQTDCEDDEAALVHLASLGI